MWNYALRTAYYGLFPIKMFVIECWFIILLINVLVHKYCVYNTVFVLCSVLIKSLIAPRRRAWLIPFRHINREVGSLITADRLLHVVYMPLAMHHTIGRGATSDFIYTEYVTSILLTAVYESGNFNWIRFWISIHLWTFWYAIVHGIGFIAALHTFWYGIDWCSFTDRIGFRLFQYKIR